MFKPKNSPKMGASPRVFAKRSADDDLSDLAMERTLLSCMARDQSLISGLNIGEDDFADPQNAQAFKIMKAIDAMGHSMSPEMFDNFVKRMGKSAMVDGKFISSVMWMDGIVSSRAEDYARAVSSMAAARRVRDRLSSMIDEISSTVDADDAIDKITNEIDRMRPGCTRTMDDMGSVLDKLERRIFSAMENPGVLSGISTGFRDVDNAMQGGFESGYHIIAARPSVGKTAITLAMALHQVSMGKRVFFASAEMKADDFMSRCIAMITGISPYQQKSGWRNSAEDKKRISDAFAWLRMRMEDCLYVDWSPRQTPNTLRRAIARASRKLGSVDICFVDYLQYMRSDDNYLKGHEKFADITMRVKDMQKELDIPVVMLAQLNRETQDDEKPNMSHLGESGQIERDADTIALMWRKEGKKMNADRELIGYEIVKGRNVGRHSCEIEFYPNKMAFRQEKDIRVLVSREVAEMGCNVGSEVVSDTGRYVPQSSSEDSPDFFVDSFKSGSSLFDGE